ncbi:MAG: hypothetical protein ABH878_02860, partial [bacterium]
MIPELRKSSRGKLWFCLLFLLQIQIVGTTSAEAWVPDSSDVSKWRNPHSFILQEEDLRSIDHEDFPDLLGLMPGSYPLDFAGFSQSLRGQVMGLPTQTVHLRFRNREIRDHLLGSPELGWIPPEALSRVVFDPFSLQSPGALISADLRNLEPVPPSSRMATRDGYYGLGTVDFDLAQKITPQLTLNGGGRVATYDGRLYHSEGYGLNLRSEVVFRDSSGIRGWGGIMQNKQNSQVPFSSINHNRDRYDADAAITFRPLTFHLYGVQQRETYGSGDADSWNELGVQCSAAKQLKALEVSAAGFISTARWRLKTQNWQTTTFGGIETHANLTVNKTWKLDLLAGLETFDDFPPARRLGISLNGMVTPWLGFTMGSTQHQ